LQEFPIVSSSIHIYHLHARYLVAFEDGHPCSAQRAGQEHKCAAWMNVARKLPSSRTITCRFFDAAGGSVKTVSVPIGFVHFHRSSINVHLISANKLLGALAVTKN